MDYKWRKFNLHREKNKFQCVILTPKCLLYAYRKYVESINRDATSLCPQKSENDWPRSSPQKGFKTLGLNSAP